MLIQNVLGRSILQRTHNTVSGMCELQQIFLHEGILHILVLLNSQEDVFQYFHIFFIQLQKHGMESEGGDILS